MLSFSGFKYFLLFLDDFSHYIRAFPLKSKSDAFDTIINIYAFVQTQFNAQIKIFQTDNVGEFHNFKLKSFFESRGTISHFTCP